MGPKIVSVAYKGHTHPNTSANRLLIKGLSLYSDPEQIRKGEQDFMELNCAACHSMDDYDPPAIASGPAPEFDLSQGYLPRFTLNRHPSSTCPLRPPVSPCSTASATSRCFPSRHSNPFSISSF